MLAIGRICARARLLLLDEPTRGSRAGQSCSRSGAPSPLKQEGFTILLVEQISLRQA